MIKLYFKPTLRNNNISIDYVNESVDLSKTVIWGIFKGTFSIDNANKQFINLVVHMAKKNNNKKNIKKETAESEIDDEKEKIKIPESVKRKAKKLSPEAKKGYEKAIKALKEDGYKGEVFVGGAVLTPEYADMIGADYYAKDAKESAEIAKKVFS